MGQEEIASRRGGVRPEGPRALLAGTRPKGKRRPPALRRKNRLDALVDSGQLGPGNDVLADAARRSCKARQVEAAMVSPAMAQAAGFDPTAASRRSRSIKRGSPFGRMNPAVRRDATRSARLGTRERHALPPRGGRAGQPPRPGEGTPRQLFPAPDPNDQAAVQAHRDQVYRWARQQYTQRRLRARDGPLDGPAPQLRGLVRLAQLPSRSTGSSAPTTAPSPRRAPTARPTARPASARAGAIRSPTRRSTATSAATPPRA